MNILLTGSSTGIGRSLAENLVGSGHRLWGLARSSQTPLTLVNSPDHFTPLRCDVSEWAQVDATFSQLARQINHLDAIITCAGIHGEIGPVFSVDPKKWSQTVRANLDGTFFTLRAGHALLKRAPRRAKVICFSGGGATKARPNFSAYGVAKTGIVRLVENIAEESRGEPLDINALAPGSINTRLTDEIIRLGPALAGAAEFSGAVKQKEAKGGSLQHVLGLIDFLLSEKSDGITGRLLAAPWDPWSTLDEHVATLAASDIYTLRRILPEDRGRKFN